MILWICNSPRWFPGEKGFSVRNLWNMKKWFLFYSGNMSFTILHQAVAELQTPDNKIDKKLHQVGAEMSEEKLSPVMREIAPQAEQIFRDQYVLEFIGGKDYEHENTMKKALINRMKDFVLEFGKDFLFIDEEYRLHQKGIYADGELDENATRKKFFLVRQEGRVPGYGYCACHK